MLDIEMSKNHEPSETASASDSSSDDDFHVISASSNSEPEEMDSATSHCASESQCCRESESEDGPRKAQTKTKTSRKGWPVDLVLAVAAKLLECPKPKRVASCLAVLLAA